MKESSMQCPKCHQPLDEIDEPYICCAGEVLQWRCERCCKVSEGFALPYGRCPHCAGRLERLDARRFEDDAALAGIRSAFEIELGGEAFYRQAATDCDDAALRELFGRFAAMEREHMRTLSRRYHLAVPVRSGGIDPAVAALQAGLEILPRDPANLFRIAIALERRAAEFFELRAEAADAGAPECQLYRELAAEEREHADLLTTEEARWRLDKPGLLGAAGA
jgi:glutamate synthase (NADPH) small chain